MKANKSGIRGVYWKPAKWGSQEIRLQEGTKQKGNWTVRYKCKLGHLHREEIGAKGLAQQIYFQRKTQVRQDSYCPRRPSTSKPVLFEDEAKKYLEWAKSNKSSWKTDEHWLKRLRRFFSGKTLDEIEPQMVERFKSEFMGDLSKATVNRHLACLKHLFTLAIRDERASRNPVKQVRFFQENNERVRWLLPEEEKQLFHVIPTPYKNFCLVALYTGMRKSELLGLQWKDLDFRSDTLAIQQAKHGDKRYIPMNSLVKDVFRLIPRRLDTQTIFHDCKNVSHRFPDWIRFAGIQNLRLHDLRHTFASRLAMAGEQLLTIKELMGHKTIEMTLRYSHLSPDHKKHAVERLISGYNGNVGSSSSVKLNS